MQLTLSGYPTNSIYTDESGAPKYKTQTRDWITSISRTLDVDIPRRQSGSEHNSVDIDKEQVRFASIGQIQWRLRKTSVFRFNDKEVVATSFFRTAGWDWYGRNRIFTARDGKEYKWRLNLHGSLLVTNDASETVVAKYRPGRLAILAMKGRKSILEIPSPFEYLADDILPTFVYIEKMRSDRK
ncbi:hypothetical protein C8J57DRAFT_1114199 [Mycena rebaudengoi]|nr:hypothetical protein C8J57DRAFT_1114199 [Mycena rebaudengoi]